MEENIAGWPKGFRRKKRNCQIDVAAKFGCAVQYARLTAHEKGSYPELLDRKKDSPYRARDQAILPTAGMCAKVSQSRSNVVLESDNTIQLTLLLLLLRSSP
jgi:hypothetical protein